MNENIYALSLQNLALAFIPVAVVLGIFIRWKLPYKTLFYAVARMLLQLIAIGYVLVYIFDQNSSIVLLSILVTMLAIASWIAMRPIRKEQPQAYFQFLLSLFLGCAPVLALVIFGVVRLDPWHQARYVIPLASMIFANSMNIVSLAAERFHSEKKKSISYQEARKAAYEAALLPSINIFFAVGLVSLPGMMTGQILAGVSPLIAVRYQIMVMTMLFGAGGIASAIYLSLQTKNTKIA